MTDRPRALAVLIAVFLLGCVVGSAGSYVWLRNRVSQPSARMQEFPPGPRPERPHFRELLQLTPEQESRFREIMEESRRQLHALDREWRTEQGPKVEKIISNMNRDLMSVLNEEQQKKFAEFLEESRSRRGRPPRGGRGLNGGRGTR